MPNTLPEIPTEVEAEPQITLESERVLADTQAALLDAHELIGKRYHRRRSPRGTNGYVTELDYHARLTVLANPDYYPDADIDTLNALTDGRHTELVQGHSFGFRYMESAELPPVDYPTYQGSEFYSRRELREESPGAYFGNMPVLGLELAEVDDTTTRVSIPSIEYINDLADRYNFNGVRFTEVDELLNGHDFLSLLSRKLFPMASESGSFTMTYHENHFVSFMLANGYISTAEVELDKFKDPNDTYVVTNLFEHDRVDHLALIALDEQSLDSIIQYALHTLEDAEANDTSLPNTDLADITNNMDWLLDLISNYAITRSDPGDNLETEYKEYIKAQITRTQERLNSMIVRATDTEPAGSNKPEINIDFEKFDESIRTFQLLKSPTSMP